MHATNGTKFHSKVSANVRIERRSRTNGFIRITIELKPNSSQQMTSLVDIRNKKQSELKKKQARANM